MKKFTALAAVSLLLAASLSGCGGREKYAGNWEASRMNVNGTVMTDIAGIPMNAMMRFELKENGSAEWMQPLESVAAPSKDGIRARWKIKGDMVILTVSQPNQEDKVLELSDKDGELVINQNGVETYLSKVDEFSEVDEEALNGKIRDYQFSQIFGS